MPKGKIVNLLLVVAVVATVGALPYYVQIKPTADRVALLPTPGIVCGGCHSRLANGLQADRGVASVKVDLKNACLIVGYDSRKTGPDGILSEVRALGFPSTLGKLLSIREAEALSTKDPDEKSRPDCCGCD